MTFRNCIKTVPLASALVFRLIAGCLLVQMLACSELFAQVRSSISDDSAIRDAIASEWKYAEEVIAGCKISARQESFTPAKAIAHYATGALAPKDQSTSLLTTISIGPEGELRLDATGEHPSPEGPCASSMTSVYVDSKLKSFRTLQGTDDKYGRIGQAPNAFTDIAWLPIYWSCAPTRYDLLGIPLMSEACHLYRVTDDGDEYIELDFTRDASQLVRQWRLDPKNRFRIVRYKEIGANGEENMQMEISYKDAGPSEDALSTLIPSEWHLVVMRNGRELIKDAKTTITSTDTGVAFSSDHFDIEFPIGTQMFEVLPNGQERHFVKAADPRDEVTQRIVGSSLAGDTNSERLDATGSLKWIVINIAAIIVLTALIYAVRRKSSATGL